MEPLVPAPASGSTGVSQADIASNQIDQNREDGIRVIQNSGVNLGTAATGHFLDVVNTTFVPNAPLGIDGTAGSKNFSDASSIDRITP